MDIGAWPTDLLRCVFEWLESDDIIKVRACGDHQFWRRVQQEAIITRLSIGGLDLPLRVIPSLGAQLRSLCLGPFSGDDPQSPVLQNCNPEWLLRLPATLESVKFDFCLATCIWLRPVQPDEDLHWSLVCNGYTPISVKDLLPNLRLLRLMGHWNQRCFWGSMKFDEGEFLAHSGTPIAPDCTSTSFVWSDEMKWRFIRNFPSGLESLEIKRDGLAWCPVPLFPPQLECFRGRSDPYLIDPAPCPLADSHYTTLKSYWWHGTDSQLVPAMVRFQQLQHLDIFVPLLHDTHIQAFPRTLTSLNMLCPLHIEDISILAGLPHLSRLTLSECLVFSSGRTRQIDVSKPINYTTILAGMHSLTTLDFVTSPFRVEQNLANLGATLPLLTSFGLHNEYSSASSLILSLKWIASPHLRSLKLHQSGIEVDTASVLSSWPANIPCNLETLIINGREKPSLSAHQLIPLLPRSLRYLKLPGTRVNRAILQDAFPHTTFVLPPTPKTVTEADWTIITSAFGLGNTPTSASVSAPKALQLASDLEELYEKQFLEWLLRYQDHPMTPRKAKTLFVSLPTSLTTIDLPTLILAPHMPLWNLPSLTSLSVRELPKSCMDRSSLSSFCGRLVYFKASAAFMVSWLTKPLFESVTSLSVYFELTGTAPWNGLTDLKRLKLTHLALGLGKLDKRAIGPIFQLIPKLVTSLECETIPEEFWKEKWPLQSLSTWTLTDVQLISLAPTLTSLSLSKLIMSASCTLTNLPPHLTTLTEDAVIRLLLPNLKHLERRHSSVCFIPDRSRQYAMEQEEEAALAQSKLNLAALPRSLVRLTTLDWNQFISDLLPPGLTWLDLRSSSRFIVDQPYLPFPSTLTALSLSVSSSPGNWSAPTKSVFEALPRSLYFLLIDDLYNITVDCVKLLPLTLQTLMVRSTDLGLPEIQLLPPGLTSLRCANLMPPATPAHFPPTLTDVYHYGARQPSRDLHVDAICE